MTPITDAAVEAAHQPCPFCGSMDIRILGPTCTKNSPYNPADRAYPIARCLGCRVDMPGRDWDKTMMSAVNAWNHRAAAPLIAPPDGAVEAAVLAERAACRKIVQRLVDVATASPWWKDTDIEPIRELVRQIDARSASPKPGSGA